ncbi:MAG: DUF433 domain-containing protein [Prolixibacteraceae bacterium]|jgi:uncharacterized protein (DUF433 family)|nr:DUF433 domain-containing protein [Prolixibacteraceae bacterium]
MPNRIAFPLGLPCDSPELFKFETTIHFAMEGRIINIDPEILGGTPVFYGTRVPIKNLFDYLETGDSIELFLEDFEGVSKDQVVKVLEMSD